VIQELYGYLNAHLTEQCTEHLLESYAQLLHCSGILFSYGSDCGRQIHCSERFMEAIVGFGKILATQGDSLVGQPFAQAQKRAFGCPRGLIAQLGILYLGDVYDADDFFGNDVRVERLEREQRSGHYQPPERMLLSIAPFNNASM
jgi:hypothetical protein